MRIIGGAFRGRRLASVGKGDAAAHLRPTSDRVRESLFNVLANAHADRLEDVRVLDLFAGTGALGLEALSRGAAHVTFVESGRTAQKLLRENIRLCGAEDVTQILPRDARKPGPAPAPCTLVFLDPPYGKGLGEQALAAALTQGWLAEDALIIWEESADITPPDGLTLLDERRYGDTFIRLLERATP
ncbi:16S rRNA (guanine(966)-N(2))-methyltransferase RsmD [Roseovarius indicus]|uniref:DNA methyltransferase n=1 Tax=Roseovarius indicus TaxID=540747 RepID=A0A0T5P2H4_9RHOB|nr:16S rRNA (guanine(966)-N(2))-methyltransferase RsmD [Roseovarius indicus]KRS15397.1 DNA methyltransferase [Roseovarius indicus]QEW28735.1 Ribosomal RNA small subunit methyltransferase D [Roseovarius indicus]SFE67870.1 16S rRNA (guanine966-N2)-methyltransferase [Roseovarius indicus]